ncbi:potassium/proton antiporter regulatory subunit, CPA2 family [Alteribacillus persepolensis]|uniref:Potassium/proton antiporter regulatory subunit, CPA2 family n=1 Tax=Alteribacillus persepolensis TaxID=568899 RepID=A0A1G8GL52_9BACI|nr:TrkA C-terminal domain-containing protein [Alteribacillus persepolensis]SDH95040.1 potassium/proton antiporter regulatory subunit, CPA2 family [Alteribacillus persepolensis]
MEVKFADLPGIGKKMSFLTAEGSMVVLVTHHTGKRELYFFQDPEEDEADFSMELTSDETRELGAQLLGAVFQPVDSDKMKLFRSKIVVEWISLKQGTMLAGKTIGEAEVRKKTGVSIVGIFRDEAVIASPGVQERLEVGDTVMVVGKSSQISDFEELAEGEAI